MRLLQRNPQRIGRQGHGAFEMFVGNLQAVLQRHRLTVSDPGRNEVHRE
jgi:hypothetical protein